MAFQKSKLMRLPRDVLIGSDVISQIDTFCSNLNLNNRALIITGSTTKKVAGERVAEQLENNGYNVEIVVIENATQKAIKKSIDMGQELGNPFFVGVGGGKVIDVSKVASFELNSKFISVPTAASHDGIASSRASIKNDEKNKVSVETIPPIGIVADTNIISKAPWRLTCSGCADVLSNYTAVKDWELAYRLKNEDYSSYASALSKMTAETLVEDGSSIKKDLEESAWIVIKSLISSGVAMSIAGSSRPASGSEHMFSHKLDKIAPKPALHGEQCGVGSIMMMYLHGGNWKGIRQVLKKIGAPYNSETLGIEPKYIVEALKKAHTIRPERYTILGKEGLSDGAAERLAKKTMVI